MGCHLTWRCIYTRILFYRFVIKTQSVGIFDQGTHGGLNRSSQHARNWRLRWEFEGKGQIDVAGTVGNADISIGTKTRVHLHRVAGKLTRKTRDAAPLEIDYGRVGCYQIIPGQPDVPANAWNAESLVTSIKPLVIAVAAMIRSKGSRWSHGIVAAKRLASGDILTKRAPC